MESFIAGYTWIETGNRWKDNQRGGRSGSSTDHVLIKMWNEIHEYLDPPSSSSNRSKAAVMCGIDFSKSFSRCSYQQILKSYKRLNASQWLIAMHGAFLTDRKMSVKVGNVMSEPKSVTGGAVQGSVLGVIDHNAVLEDIDEDIRITSEKYVET